MTQAQYRLLLLLLQVKHSIRRVQKELLLDPHRQRMLLLLLLLLFLFLLLLSTLQKNHVCKEY
jgi:hypothetical protein